VLDPDFYDVLFAGAPARRDKPPTWSHAFINVESVFGTILHDVHRRRRNALAPFFSTSSLRQLEPLVQDKLSRLIAVLRRYQSTGEPIQLLPAFGALTCDIITEYCKCQFSEFNFPFLLSYTAFALARYAFYTPEIYKRGILTPRFCLLGFGISEDFIEAAGFNAIVMEAANAQAEKVHITVNAQWLPKLLDMFPAKLLETLLGKGMAKFNVLKRVSLSNSLTS
jgi:hypothetical protein